MNLLIRARFSLVRVYLCQAGRSLRNALRVLLFGPRRSLPEALVDALAAPPSHPSAQCKCACEPNCEREAHDATCEWAAIMCRGCVGGNGYCQRCGGDGTEPPNAPPLPAPASSAPEVAVVVGAVAWIPLGSRLGEGVKAQFTASVELSALDPAHRDFMAALSSAVAAQDTLRLVLRVRD